MLPVIFSVASSGGRIVLPAPTLTVGASAGQFIIQDYNASYTYSLSVDAGTITRSGNIVTLSSSTANGTVRQRNPKGLTNSAATTIQRQPITYYSCNCVIVDSYEVSGCCCPAGYNYEDYGWIKYCRLYSCSTCENSPPSGWTKTNGEWTKIS